MNPIGALPPGISEEDSPRLLVINNMPAYYRTPPFSAMLEEYSRRTGGSGLVAYQVRRDSHGRGEWFFTPDSEFPYNPYFSAADTKYKPGRTGYPIKSDVALWRQYRPDHVFTAGWDSPLSLSAAAYSRLSGARLGVWVESNSTTSQHRGGPADMARRAFLRSADFAVVPTQSSADYVTSLAARDMPCVRLRNPVSWERLAESTVVPTSKRMVFIGDLSKRKGFDYFAAAAARGAAEGWVGVAYGRDVECLATTAPANLLIQPAIPLAEIIPQLRATDVLMITSRLDPAPLTFSEGLALGLRMVISERIAYGEDADSVSGIAQVDPADSTAVLATANWLLGGPRPDEACGAEVTADYFAAGVLGAFGL